MKSTTKKQNNVGKNGNGFYSEKTLKRYADALRDAKKKVCEDHDNGVLRVKISNGNNKTGRVRFVSLLPLVTCDACDGGVCAGTCREYCYATRDCRNKNVLQAYAYNTAFWMLYPDEYFRQLSILTALDRYFRWHSSGDITSVSYFDGVVRVARANPTTQYVIMTKRYSFVNKWIDNNGGVDAIPDNLVVIFSGWYNLQPDNPHNLPTTTAYKNDEDWSDEWLSCGGNCEDCAVHGLGCFRMQRGECVAFKLH